MGNTYQVALKNIPEILHSSLTLNRTVEFCEALKLIRSNYSPQRMRSSKIYEIQSDCPFVVYSL